MFTDFPDLDIALRALILGPVTLIWITLLVRIVGLRSFSKMTAVDFVTTVATGSLLANAAVAANWGAFLQSSLAMAALLAMQALVSWMRIRSLRWLRFFENEPILLMRDGSVIAANMQKARVTPDDLRAKLREANVLALTQVRAVVLETTGDISVLHGEHLDKKLLESVKGTP